MSGLAGHAHSAPMARVRADVPKLEPLFKIGLRPMAFSDWLQPDEKRDAYLAEKEALLATRFDDVFVGGSEVLESQEIVHAAVCDFLSVTRQKPDGPPLLAAARMVREDLVIMSKRAGEWVLASACVCFPSSWNLREKHLKPMDQIHGSVPGFGPATRNASLIHRIFDQLDVSQPVERMNWSLYSDGLLFHGDVEGDAVGESGSITSLADVFVRTERQTLRKLEETGDIVFTVLIDVEPFEALQSSRDFGSLVTALRGNLEALNEREAEYKGLEPHRHQLVDALRALEGASS